MWNPWCFCQPRQKNRESIAKVLKVINAFKYIIFQKRLFQFRVSGRIDRYGFGWNFGSFGNQRSCHAGSAEYNVDSDYQNCFQRYGHCLRDLAIYFRLPSENFGYFFLRSANGCSRRHFCNRLCRHHHDRRQSTRNIFQIRLNTIFRCSFKSNGIDVSRRSFFSP